MKHGMRKWVRIVGGSVSVAIGGFLGIWSLAVIASSFLQQGDLPISPATLIGPAILLAFAAGGCIFIGIRALRAKEGD